MREQIPDDGDARRAGGNHMRRCLQRDASNGNDGPTCSDARRLRHSFEPDWVVPRRFRRGAKDGPDSDVRHRLMHGCFDLRRSVCGIADDRVGSEQAARSGWREVFLSHVRSRRVGQKRHVHAIVHDHACAVRTGGMDQTFGVVE